MEKPTQETKPPKKAPRKKKKGTTEMPPGTVNTEWFAAI